MSLRVLIADDHPIFRAGLARTVVDAGMQLLGEAHDGHEALSLVSALEPDVILMDVNMPGINGVEATRQILAAEPDTAVLILTMHDDDETVRAALRAGARGYLVKGADAERIVAAVRAVASGEVVLGTEVVRGVLNRLNTPQQSDSAPIAGLTHRETQILDAIAAGKNNRMIARELYLSDKTVRNNVSIILAKLGVADRSAAIVKAREAGLGQA